MRKKGRALSIMLSMLMAVQMPAMAGELVVEAIPVQEEFAEEDVVTEEESMEDPIETITEEVDIEEIGIVPAEEKSVIEEEPALVGEASGQCGDNVYWSLSDDWVLTISGTGDMWDYKWDASIDDYNIPWRADKDIINTVIIESEVTSIGSYAFRDCTSLTSVTIGDSVTRICGEAFYKCTSLTSVTIPDSVTSIWGYAFQDCTSLASVTIPDSVTSIGAGAFAHCSSLTSMTIPDSVTFICNGMFKFCSSLTSVTIPDRVSCIYDEVFYGCSSLTSVTIPDSVTSIGKYAFYECSSLTSVTIPDNVTSIDYEAFAYCGSLTSVTIGGSVFGISYGAFEYCNSLKIIIFDGNSPTFGKNVFYNVTATAYYPADNRTWTEKRKQNYGGNITWVPWSPSPEVQLYEDTLKLPNSTTTIESESFAGLTQGVNIDVPSTVTHIADDAFESSAVVIIGEAGGYVEEFCNDHKIPFSAR